MPDTPNTPQADPSPAPAAPHGPTALARPVVNVAQSTDGTISLAMFANVYVNHATGDVELGARNYKTANAAEERARTHSIRDGLAYVGPVPVMAHLTAEQTANIRDVQARAAAAAHQRALDRARDEELNDDDDDEDEAAADRADADGTVNLPPTDLPDDGR